MSNPIARRLGITKTWNNNTQEQKFLFGFLKALNIYSSEIFIVSHNRTIFLYIFDPRSPLKKFNSLYYYFELFKLIYKFDTNLHLVVINSPYWNSWIFLNYLYYSLSLRANVRFNLKYRILFNPARRLLNKKIWLRKKAGKLFKFAKNFRPFHSYYKIHDKFHYIDKLSHKFNSYHSPLLSLLWHSYHSKFLKYSNKLAKLLKSQKLYKNLFFFRRKQRYWKYLENIKHPRQLAYLRRKESLKKKIRQNRQPKATFIYNPLPLTVHLKYIKKLKNFKYKKLKNLKLFLKLQLLKNFKSSKKLKNFKSYLTLQNFKFNNNHNIYKLFKSYLKLHNNKLIFPKKLYLLTKFFKDSHPKYLLSPYAPALYSTTYKKTFKFGQTINQFKRILNKLQTLKNFNQFKNIKMKLYTSKNYKDLNYLYNNLTLQYFALKTLSLSKENIINKKENYKMKNYKIYIKLLKHIKNNKMFRKNIYDKKFWKNFYKNRKFLNFKKRNFNNRSYNNQQNYNLNNKENYNHKENYNLNNRSYNNKNYNKFNPKWSKQNKTKQNS